MRGTSWEIAKICRIPTGMQCTEADWWVRKERIILRWRCCSPTKQERGTDVRAVTRGIWNGAFPLSTRSQPHCKPGVGCQQRTQPHQRWHGCQQSYKTMGQADECSCIQQWDSYPAYIQDNLFSTIGDRVCKRAVEALQGHGREHSPICCGCQHQFNYLRAHRRSCRGCHE